MISEENTKDFGKLLRWSLMLVVILGAFLAVQTISALKEYSTIGQGVYPNKTLTVTGEGEVFATPDIAQFSFTVTQEADSITGAQEVVTQKIDNALEMLADAGVEEKDIKTTGYNAYPQYSYTERLCISGACPPQERVLSGYEVSQTISVKVRDTSKAGEVLSQVASTGISNVSGLQFVIDDESALLAEARAKAIANAEEKITSLAKDLGVKVKGVVSFSEDSGDYYPRYEQAMNASVGFGGDMKELSAPQLPTGENATRVQVYITYEIK